jgi:selenide,water dikinase
VIEVMATLNRKAAEIMAGYTVHACTDITGFGLLGHALEMAQGSKVTLAIETKQVPVLPEVIDLAGMGLIPAGSYANRKFCARSVREVGAVDSLYLDIIADAQTSGGLLLALPAAEAPDAVSGLRGAGVADAAIIGEVLDRSDGIIEVS